MKREITSLDRSDERLAAFANVRDRDLEGHHGLFMLEGRLVLEAALDHADRYPLEAILVADNRLSRYSAVLERVPEEVPIYVLPREAMYELVGFPIHRGLLAAAKRAERPSAESLLAAMGDGARTVLVLEGLTNHDNVGACFRNAAAFGVDAVLLDGTCCDPLYRKAVRVSVGHVLAVPWAREERSATLLEMLKQAGFVSCALAVCRDATPLTRCERPAQRVALLLGSEGPGLAPATLEAADQRLYIPMSGAVDSLNVATAGAVAMFALRS